MGYILSLDSAKYSLYPNFSTVYSDTQQPALIPVLHSHQPLPCAPQPCPEVAVGAAPQTVHTHSSFYAESF